MRGDTGGQSFKLKAEMKQNPGSFFSLFSNKLIEGKISCTLEGFIT